MAKEFVRDGKLDREAAAEALRDFLKRIVSAAHFDLTVTVRTAQPTGSRRAGSTVFRS